MIEDAHSASHDPGSQWSRYVDAVLGFRDYWYPVLLSRQLGRKPRSITLCGEEIVLVRDQGRVYGLRDRCPHRGVPLSAGRCEFAGTLTCAYHGWTYDLASGDLAAALTDGPESPIIGKASVRVQTYRVEERAGLIWVWVGDGEPSVPVETDIPTGLLRPNLAVEGLIRVQKGNWRYAAEAGVDEGHVKYLHRRSLWTFFRELPAWNVIRVLPTDDGEWQARIPQHTSFGDHYPGVGWWPPRPRFWQSRAREPAPVGFRLPCWVRIQRRDWTAYEVYVPRTPDTYLSVLLATRQATGFAALRFRAWYYLYSRWAYQMLFNGQDQWMIEHMRIPPEQLYRPDVSVISWRKLCHQQARGAPIGASRPTPTAAVPAVGRPR
jgi:nitrite reductase/ring-hydroxylating ferredoxin subunit